MASTAVVDSVGVACLLVPILLSKYSSREDKLDNASEYVPHLHMQSRNVDYFLLSLVHIWPLGLSEV